MIDKAKRFHIYSNMKKSELLSEVLRLAEIVDDMQQRENQAIENALYDLSSEFRYEFEGNYGLSEVEDFIHNYANQLHQKA